MFKVNMLQFFYTLIIIAIIAARPGKFYTIKIYYIIYIRIRNHDKSETNKNGEMEKSLQEDSGDSLQKGSDETNKSECTSEEKRKMGCATCACSDYGQWLCAGLCPPGM